MAMNLNNLQANLAATLFQGTAKDVMATADIYGVSNTSVINTLTGKFNPFNGSLLANLHIGSQGILSSLSGVMNFGNALGQINLNSTGISSRLGNALGGQVSNFSPAFQTNLSGAVGRTSGAFSSFDVTINGLTTQISSYLDLPSLSGALSVINQLTGNSRFSAVVDVGSTGASLSASLQTLIGAGLGINVGAVISGINSPRAVNQALVSCVPTAIQQSDINTLQLAVNHAGAAAIHQTVPQTIPQLLQSYRIPVGTPSSQYPTLYTALKALLDSLEKGWDTYLRNGTALVSLKYFAVASKDALTILATNTSYTVACAIASRYPAGKALDALKREYPYMLIVA